MKRDPPPETSKYALKLVIETARCTFKNKQVWSAVGNPEHSRVYGDFHPRGESYVVTIGTVTRFEKVDLSLKPEQKQNRFQMGSNF